MLYPANFSVGRQAERLPSRIRYALPDLRNPRNPRLKTCISVLYECMSEHKITLTWKRGDLPFDYQKYPRNHTWKFDGGHEMTASAAPAYLGDPKHVDPEEAFVASLS